MTNALIEYIQAKGLNEILVLNALQDFGVISSNCVWAFEVAPDDWPVAIAWLVENY